ncbi:MAG: hypothetical protein H0U29_10005, partial [Acidimicrobiia bacterium]|nr:hypothetical protein [Acidimicrobiia bacterium]
MVPRTRRVGPILVLVAVAMAVAAAVEGIAGHLDGWNREDVSATYDFDADEY